MDTVNTMTDIMQNSHTKKSEKKTQMFELFSILTNLDRLALVL